MSEKEINALKDALKLENNIKLFVEKYGIEALRIILNHVGFFEKVGILNPEEVDKNELEEQLKGLPLGNSDPVHNNLKVDESSRPEDFGLYKKVLDRGDASNGDTSIYAQDPSILSKVEKDRTSHPQSETMNEPLTESMGNDKPLYTGRLETPDSHLTKVLEKNPWADVGAPVAPGQIKFD